LPAGTSRSTGASAVNDDSPASKTIETSLSTSRGGLFTSHSTSVPELNCAKNEICAQSVPKLSFLSHDDRLPRFDAVAIPQIHVPFMGLHPKRTIACANTRWRSRSALTTCAMYCANVGLPRCLLVYRAGRTLVHQPGWTGAGTSLTTPPVRTNRLELLRAPPGVEPRLGSRDQKPLSCSAFLERIRVRVELQ
jgi:hypothetical protein